MDGLLRHSQRKRGETDRPNLKPRRPGSTLLEIFSERHLRSSLSAIGVRLPRPRLQSSRTTSPGGSARRLAPAPHPPDDAVGGAGRARDSDAGETRLHDPMRQPVSDRRPRSVPHSSRFRTPRAKACRAISTGNGEGGGSRATGGGAPPRTRGRGTLRDTRGLRRGAETAFVRVAPLPASGTSRRPIPVPRTKPCSPGD
jgi:hypothetical protein